MLCFTKRGRNSNVSGCHDITAGVGQIKNAGKEVL